MVELNNKIKSVAIIGAGAAGVITAAALKAEKYFEKITIFERRESAGGTWIYDPSPSDSISLKPGKLPPAVDPPIPLPSGLPTTREHIKRERFSKTPIYEDLTTNVPSIVMSFSDIPFPYGPFVPHHVPKQYLENYIAQHKLDGHLELNTTVEDVSKISDSKKGDERWKLTLRRFNILSNVDEWSEEVFNAVVLANGHYAVPFIPQVDGLEEYIKSYPQKIQHSKTYRSSTLYTGKNVLVIGNSASGFDITNNLLKSANLPIYQSRRSPSRWDGASPPKGVVWKPIIQSFSPNTGRITFSGGTFLEGSEIDVVIYCTGYLPSYPFWNVKNNVGKELYSYTRHHLLDSYQHTFFTSFPTLAIVGFPRVLSWRSYEYQALAISRLWSERNKSPLPSKKEMRKWEEDREAERKKSGKKFHDIEWETGETMRWLGWLYEFAGLRRLEGEGRNPSVLGEKERWAIENVRKYPEPRGEGHEDVEEMDWEVVGEEEIRRKDLLHFI